VVTCTGNGTITIPAGITSVRYLLVAGGGGGGGINAGTVYGAGGGGAGGVLYGNAFAVTPGNYPVVVGSGGTAGTGAVNGGNGANSTFSTLTAIGGGGGAREGGNDGVVGGSGGGGSGNRSGAAGTLGQGNAGGNGNNNDGGGGGGGAGANGVSANNTGVGGNGGNGYADNISGASTTYGGGGGGGGSQGLAGGAGGAGGGATAPTGRGPGVAGTANTGGGGSGASGSAAGAAFSGGPGGAGIVIIRYILVIIAAPTVTTNPASAVTDTGTTLNGTVSSNNAITDVTFEYGLDTTYGATITAAQSPLAAAAIGSAVSADVAGLTCGTLYHFRAIGANSAGTSYGGDLTFTTAPCLNCFTDNFTGSDGSSPSSDWTTTSSSGAFGDPKIYNNQLRLTDASGNVATAAHLQRMFPGSGNKIIVEFDYFAYNGSGADGIALTFSDASISPQAGAYGGSLGYAQRCGVSGFTGGWLGIGIDEYGNFRNDEECRGDGPPPNGRAIDSVSVRGSGSGTTGYLIHAESGTLAPPVDQPGATPGPGHRYRVIIDHSNNINSWVTVERDSGSGYVTIIPQYDAKAQAGQAAVPTNWMLSYTGSTGGATNIHEIDNLSVCTAQPILPIGGPHHIRLEHDGTAISCAAETVVIKACADAACSTLYAGGVTGNLTAGGNSVPFIIPSGQSQITTGIHLPSDSALADPQIVRLGTNSVLPTPTDISSPYCSINAEPVDTTTACDMGVYKAGFLFDVPNLTSGTASGTVNISAVRSSDSSTCAPLFQNVTRTVAFWGEYQNPASGTLLLQVNGLGIETTTAPTYSSTFSLAFDNAGAAPLTSVRYDDVGLMQLSARYIGSTANTPPDGGMIALGSDTFVVSPDHFVLTNIRQTAAPNLANPAAADASGNKFVKAGEQFSITVTATNSLGIATPNYGKEIIPEWVGLTSTLVAGLGLTTNPDIGRLTTGSINNVGTTLNVASSAGFSVGDRIRVAGAGVAGADLLTTITAVPGVNQITLASAASTTVAGAQANYTFPSFNSGSATGTNFTWDEVGIITITPSIGDGDYLGAGNVIGTITGNIGRFYPDHFITSISSNGSFLNSGTGFTYTGQPFTYNTAPVITITAQNIANGTTLNYRDTFRLLTVNDVTLGYPTTDTTTDVADLSVKMPLSTTPAVASLSTTNPMSFTLGVDWFEYTRTLPYDTDNALIGPFTADIALQLIAATDSDGVTANDLGTPKNINPPGIEIRYGRGVATNSFGPETLPIILSAAAEFYDVTGNWAINIIDNSTNITYTKTENVADFTVSESPASPLTTTSGLVTLTLTPATDPDAATNAGGTIVVDYNFPTWLEPDVQTTATFGIYRGNDRIIHWREIIR
jgi:MSHA biogenesis protein MshQ